MKRLVAEGVAALVRLLTGVRLVSPVVGESERLILAANHASNLDALVIWAACPSALRRRLRPVAAAEYWQASWLRRWIAGMMRVVLIPRTGITRANSPIDPLVAELKAGSVILIFPHGTRRGRVEDPLKSGVFHIARKAAPVTCLPLYLHNLSRILPVGEWVPLPLIGQLTAGEPVAFVPEEGRDAFLNRLHAELLRLAKDAEPRPNHD